ncbi:MAG TPA: hypothetical protein VGG02_01625 [Chthoniobacterales bacterium]|jgi:hypothetical protein
MKKSSFARFFLGLAAALLLFGGILHTRAFPKAVAAVGNSNLAPFFGKALQGLWLIDSTVLFTLGFVFGLLALRPRLASGAVIVLVGVIPAMTAVLLYRFIGAFPAAHLLLAVTVCVVLAGSMWNRNA